MNEFFLKYQDHFQPLKVKRGNLLLEEGMIARQIYFVEEGILRLWYNHDGEEITIQFFQEEQWVGSFESFYDQLPSQFNLEAVTRCQLWTITYDTLQQLINQDSSEKDILFAYIVRRFGEYSNLFLSRIKNSPEERYEEVLDLTPELLERVPHYMIASYLGITPVSLSRIRKRFSD